MLAIPVLLGLLIVLGLLGRLLWRWTQSWPVVWRLLLISVTITPLISIFTPTLVMSESHSGHPAFTTVGIALFYCVASGDIRVFHESVFVPLIAIFAFVCAVASIVVAIRHGIQNAKPPPAA